MLENEWQPSFVFFPKTLITGERARKPGVLMRKRDEAGGWIYRLPTYEEESDHQSREIW
jgi:hypothetical protein